MTDGADPGSRAPMSGGAPGAESRPPWFVPLAWIGGGLFFGFVATVVGVILLPAQLLLTAPVFCDDDHPDAFVVIRREGVADLSGRHGGGDDFDLDLYCVGETGSVTSTHASRPMLLLLPLYAVPATVVTRRVIRRAGWFEEGAGGRTTLGASPAGSGDGPAVARPAEPAGPIGPRRRWGRR